MLAKETAEDIREDLIGRKQRRAALNDARKIRVNPPALRLCKRLHPSSQKSPPARLNEAVGKSAAFVHNHPLSPCTPGHLPIPMTSLTSIARVARVSTATVSRVLNDPGLVKERTRLRVQRAMTRLDYRPNRVAQRLRQNGGLRKLIGLVIPEIENHHFAEIVRGVEEAAYARNFAVILCNSDDDPAKEKFYLDLLRAESVDGVIVPPIHDRDPVLLAAAASGLPLVAIDRRLEDPTVDTILVDNRLGATLAMEHLLKRGHRTIAHIAGPQQNSTMRDRWTAWAETLAAHRISIGDNYVWWGDNQQDSGAAGAEVLLALKRRPGAIFVGNNLMAAGALEVIYRHGLAVPDDIAVVGFDDPPWARALRPALTVIRQPTHKIGQLAVELILRRLKNPKSPVQHVMLTPELVVRDSS
jgi:DNA-binding LacI/PurR family transcriptional regulator